MRHPITTPIGRFGIETDEEADGRCVAHMPVHGLLSPITGTPSLGPLAVLVDHVGGAAVIAAHPDTPVVGTARPVGPKSTTGLGECDLVIGGAPVGTGTVRSYFIDAPGQLAEWPTDDGAMTAKIGLAAMMATGEPRPEQQHRRRTWRNRLCRNRSGRIGGRHLGSPSRPADHRVAPGQLPAPVLPR